MKRERNIFLSIITAIVFLFISYYVTNLDFPISGEKVILSWFETYRNFYFASDYKDNDSIFLIDVSYDKQLVAATDINGIPQGYRPITDRRKLVELLQYLKAKNDYKYILLDVLLTERFVTDSDSLLYKTILSMDRIVIPCPNNDENLGDSMLLSKAAYADYIITPAESDFVKYPYLPECGKSLPLKMYEDITKHSIRQFGPLYFDGWRLVRKSVVLTLDFLPNNSTDYIQERIYHNLGLHLLGDSLPEFEYCGQKEFQEKPYLTKNKYLVIGALREKDDIHDTYFGQVSGAIINMNAYLSLLHGHHVVSVSLLIVLFLTFFILSYLTYNQQDLADVLEKWGQESNSRVFKVLMKIMSFTCSWLGYSFFLTILCIGTYCFLGEVYDIFVTSTLFYFLGKMVSLINKKKTK